MYTYKITMKRVLDVCLPYITQIKNYKTL